MADMKPQGTQAYSVESGYESGDANVKSVIAGLSIILMGTFIVMLAMFGMFRVLNGRVLEQEAKTPVALAQRIVPPEPRLLPSPYTDEAPEANRANAVAQKNGVEPKNAPNRMNGSSEATNSTDNAPQAVNDATEDSYPWDKRNLEIGNQYAEANAQGKGADGKPRISIERAMSLEAGLKPDAKTETGTAAAMTWQPEYPSIVAGKNAEGSMNLEPGTTRLDPKIFDRRPEWESNDEKYDTEASGGLSLKAGELSR